VYEALSYDIQVKMVLAEAQEEHADEAFRIPRLGSHWSEGKSVREEVL
jgi:hypothetical protein